MLILSKNNSSQKILEYYLTKYMDPVAQPNWCIKLTITFNKLILKFSAQKYTLTLFYD